MKCIIAVRENSSNHNEYAEIKRPDLLQRRTNWQKYNNHHRDNDNNGVHLPEYK